MKISTTLTLAVVGTVALGIALTSNSYLNGENLQQKAEIIIPEIQYEYLDYMVRHGKSINSASEFAERLKLYQQAKA